MARGVIWTQTAWSDLEAVADYIAKDSRHYAAVFVDPFGRTRSHRA